MRDSLSGHIFVFTPLEGKYNSVQLVRCLPSLKGIGGGGKNYS